MRSPRARDPDKQSVAEALKSLPDFDMDEALSATGGKADQIKYLREKSKKKLEKSEDYLHPKKAPLILEDVKGVKIYVLGPPENIEWIKKLERESELYPKLREMNKEAAFTAAVLKAGGETTTDNDRLFWRSRARDDFIE